MGNNNENEKELDVVDNNEENSSKEVTIDESSEKVAEPKKEKKINDSKKKEKSDKKEVDSWFIKVLKEEHKWETYLLGFISCFAMGVGALVLSGVLVFKDGTPVLSDYADIVGWVFVIFGLLGFILFIIPIFRPTKKELKHLSLPSKSLFLGNVVRVFLFLIIMASIFLLYEAVISAVKGVV